MGTSAMHVWRLVRLEGADFSKTRTDAERT